MGSQVVSGCCYLSPIEETRAGGGESEIVKLARSREGETQGGGVSRVGRLGSLNEYREAIL